MYAETGLMFPYFPQEFQQLGEFACSEKFNASSGVGNSEMISDFNLWGEGDLFQPPELVTEEPVIAIDPMTAAISMMSCGEDVIIPPQSMSVSDIESSIEKGQLISEVFYECRKDLLAKEGNGSLLSEALDIKIPTAKTDETLSSVVSSQKSDSSGFLKLEAINEALPSPTFPKSSVLNFGDVYGMRRAFSEGDIKTLGADNISFMVSQTDHPNLMGRSSSSLASDVRREKLSRYRSKKSRRNFDRKIKYACRKALADSQPRIRGRFAKTEEMETLKKL